MKINIHIAAVQNKKQFCFNLHSCVLSIPIQCRLNFNRSKPNFLILEFVGQKK